MENTDILNLGTNKYTKIKYSPLQMAETGLRYMYSLMNSKSEDAEKLFREALKKVYVNGELLDGEIKLNNHFAKYPKEIRIVMQWALLEGLQDFLDAEGSYPEVEGKYLF